MQRIFLTFFNYKFYTLYFFQGLINHSSLWSTEIDGKENKLSQRKNSKQVLPRMTKPLKRQSSGGINLESFPYKTYRKPQFYFY